MENKNKISGRSDRFYLPFLFFAYAIILGLSVFHHEPWGDELHSWNIAKNSSGLLDLISNTRYEGHPPLWYILLYLLSLVTHDPLSIQYLQFFICLCSAFIFIFYTRIELLYKVLVLSGYYFLYEYAAFSRNYAIGILFSFLVCLVLSGDRKKGIPIYYLLLFLLSNTHFLSLILAASFQIYFLYRSYQQKESKGFIFCHAASGALLLVPALYFIMPPSNSSLNGAFWLEIWNKDQLFMIVQAPLRALVAIPAWWEYHSWNTNALLRVQKTYNILKYINPILSVGSICSIVYILYPYKKSLLFFATNLAFTFLFGLLFPLTTARYVGFIFIAFLLSLLLLNRPLMLAQKRKIVLCALLTLQIIGSYIALKRDLQFPFSNAGKLVEIDSRLILKDNLVTDYWCLNYLSAYLDRPVYCLGFNKKKSFLLWDTEMKKLIRTKNSYTQGMEAYFKEFNKTEVYFISNTPKSDIMQRDSLFFRTFNIEFLEGREDAIEKYSNIYLYKISSRKDGQP